MNKGKVIMAGIAAMGAITASAATITGVTAKQLHPWDRKVYISYILTGDLEEDLPEDAYLVNTVQLTATDRANSTNYIAVAHALSGDTGAEEGVHHIVWDLNAQGIEFNSDDVVFAVAYKYYAKYCVVNLGYSSSRVNYVMNPPSGGFNTDEYKTANLVLKLIKKDSPYYIGIFEVTQHQYYRIMGEKPFIDSWHGEGDALPVVASWNTIRGDSSIYDWPSSRKVDPSSFVGRIQACTGLQFDLPTESQWEYACRAGTTSKFNNGGNTENDLKELGRYAGNGGAEYYVRGVDNPAVIVSIGGAVEVGSYHANKWGLFDMHGNVAEWCLDHPAYSDSRRVIRGGSWGSGMDSCASSCRMGATPSVSGIFPAKDIGDSILFTFDSSGKWPSIDDWFNAHGFRIVMNPEVVSSGIDICSGGSSAISVDSRIEPTVDAVNISWDASWIGGDANATVVIEDNGVEVMRTIGVGEFTHELLGAGRHDLTYTTYIDGVAQDEICSATVFKDWKYEVTNDCAVIVETSQTTGAVTIPSVIDGHPVIGIAEGLFAGCTNLTSVVIPSSVWDIGREAFKDCTGLRRVEVVKGLKWTLESQDAFEGCSPDLEIIYAPTAEVRDVVAKQRFPWNGKVDITYTLTGDLSVGLPKSKPNYFVFGVTATNRVDGTTYAAAPDALSGDISTAAGTHHVVWDLNAQGIKFKSEDVVFTVAYTVLHADMQYSSVIYCVVDLSEGESAAQYPVTYMMEPPSGGFNAHDYKTTKLVLRLINPGAFMMQGKYEVVLTRPFYCGIFEVTQRQYELVTGSNPSDEKGDTIPVNQVSWNAIRGNSSTYNWPSSSNVDSSTFIGRLQARTGLNFDLPTEAEWEYACRAGTTSLYNNGGNTTNDLNQLGRYKDNHPYITSSFAFVGSYLPNAWGLYDMHGNADELCLDYIYYGNLTSGMTDPSGPATGSDRLTRGGGCYSAADVCTSSKHLPAPPSAAYTWHGFRLVRTCSKVEGTQNIAVVSGVRRDDALCVGGSAPVSVNLLENPIVGDALVQWNAAWIGGSENATVVISDNGTEVKRVTGTGEFMYAFPDVGRHDLTYTTYIDGVAQDEVYATTVYAQWKYEVRNGGATITETTQKAGAVEIPSTIDGYPVIGISKEAFAGCSGLTSVKIPASVWDVGYRTFGDCTGLQRVEVARGLRNALAAQDAFEGCPQALEIVYYSTGEVRDVTAKQRFPWNGKIDINYTLTGDISAGCMPFNQPSLLVVATNRVDGTFYVATGDALSGDTGAAAGAHHVVWDMLAQGIDFRSGDVVFIVAYRYEKYDRYCVIDLSSGGAKYPVSYMSEPPSSGFNTDEYKTTKLVMRLIWPGSFKMGGEYDVTLTKPYYCGIFEVTQKQYELVTSQSPSYFTNTSNRATRPVESITWKDIRGDSATNWPSSTVVDWYSFVGRIQSRTGLYFDLPTEAQWEYACRAGTVTDYNNGKNNMGIKGVDEIGRFSVNSGGDYSQSRSCSTSVGTAKVGSYLPNAWGLYDMHGNVEEWCLDLYGQLASGVSDPVGSSSGVYRVLRGGGWCHSADVCTSLYRHYDTPSVPTYFSPDDYYFRKSGFRLVGNVGVNVHEVRFEIGRYFFVYFAGRVVGRTNVETFEVAHGSQLGGLLDMVQTPTTNGYYFAGWWTKRDGGTQAQPTTTITSSTTFYPHWTGIAYAVTLDQQSGSGGASTATAIYGSAMPTVTVPMRTGFMFDGYWTGSNGEGTQYYTASGESAHVWDQMSDMTLYAKWIEAEKYTVTFDRQGGSGGSSSVVAMYGSAMPFIAVPTRSGYIFDGYWSGANGSGVQYYDASGKSARMCDMSSKTVLYAKWIAQ